MKPNTVNIITSSINKPSITDQFILILFVFLVSDTVNQTPPDDDSDGQYVEPNHMYDQVNEQDMEGASHIEMRSINSEDANYYITPII